MTGGVRVNIDAAGFQQLQNTLESMAVRGVRMAPLMRRLGVALIGIVHTNFDVQGRPRWKPLSVKTVWSYQEAAVQQTRNTKKWQNAKRASTKGKYEDEAAGKVSQHKLLMQTGELRNSIMLGAVTDMEIEIGSSLPYARIQQLGGTIGPITVRPRNKKALLIPTQYGTIVRRGASIPERKIPARPYLAVSAEDIPLLAGITMRYIREGV